MKYRNASEILPDKLLREVQKYIRGEALYIPAEDDRRKWGEASGARRFYAERNAEIRAKHKQNESLEALAEIYGLSEDTIRKIIFKQ